MRAGGVVDQGPDLEVLAPAHHCGGVPPLADVGGVGRGEHGVGRRGEQVAQVVDPAPLHRCAGEDGAHRRAEPVAQARPTPPRLRAPWEGHHRGSGARELWRAARRAGPGVGRDQGTRLARRSGTGACGAPSGSAPPGSTPSCTAPGPGRARWSCSTRTAGLRCHSGAGGAVRVPEVRRTPRGHRRAALDRTVGDSFDAPAETVMGSDEAELVAAQHASRRGGAWRRSRWRPSARCTGTTRPGGTATSAPSRPWVRDGVLRCPRERPHRGRPPDARASTDPGRLTVVRCGAAAGGAVQRPPPASKEEPEATCCAGARRSGCCSPLWASAAWAVRRHDDGGVVRQARASRVLEGGPRVGRHPSDALEPGDGRRRVEALPTQGAVTGGAVAVGLAHRWAGPARSWSSILVALRRCAGAPRWCTWGSWARRPPAGLGWWVVRRRRAYGGRRPPGRGSRRTGRAGSAPS